MATTKKPAGKKVPRISKEKVQQMRQMLVNTTKTVAQVAKELGVSKGTVYYQTGGKKKALEMRAAYQLEKARAPRAKKRAAAIQAAA